MSATISPPEALEGGNNSEVKEAGEIGATDKRKDVEEDARVKEAKDVASKWEAMAKALEETIVRELSGSEGEEIQVSEEEKQFIQSKALIYEQLIEEYPPAVGKALSRKERTERGHVGTALVYGEISFPAFATVFLRLKKLYGAMPIAGGEFFDLGSGTGKPVFAAALLHDLEACTGIEILEGLHQASKDIQNRKWAPIAESLGLFTKHLRMKFVLGDCTNLSVCDWTKGSLVFANSTCFDGALLRSIAQCAEKMRPGSFFVSLTKKLPSEAFDLLESRMYEMSWGTATVFIHRRRQPPAT